VKRSILNLLNKQINRNTEKDIWKFESQKEIWNEFIIHYTKLINDSNVKFNQEYTNKLEVNRCCVTINGNNIFKFLKYS